MAIITLAQLAPWVGRTVADLEANPLALPVVERASLLVNEAAWGITNDAKFWALPDRPAPASAQQIAEALAARVFSNPRVVQARSTGPMNERLADVVLTGMALRPDETERLRAMHLSGQQGGAAGQLWILSLEPELPEAPLDTVPYVETYQPHPPGVTYLSTDYDHV